MAEPQKAPKTQRGKRALNKKAPKVTEIVKSTLFLKGPKSSDIVTHALKDLHSLKKPNSKLLTKRNMTRPFEDQSSIEFLSSRNGCGLFGYCSHSKKRPHNLVFGRLFDNVVLDMMEFSLNPSTFKPLTSFSSRKSTVQHGLKPLVLFNGDEFETNPNFVLAKNLFLDFFRGQVLDKVNLAGLDRVIVFTAAQGQILFRQFAVTLEKSGSKSPHTELIEIGPRMDLTFRRAKSAPEDVRRRALKVARQVVKVKADGTKKSLQKNIEEGPMGDRMGRVHLQKQELDQMALKKMKGLVKRKQNPVAANPQATESKATESKKQKTDQE